MFVNITGMSFTQIQATNIAYVIIHSTGKFGLAIHEWNLTPTVQKTWVGFKHFFGTAHQELRKTLDITVKEAGMNHAKMVRDVVVGMKEVLQQDQAPTSNLIIIQ